MNAEQAQVNRVERVDDIPVLLATLKQMKVDEILDRHYPTGHRWQGELTFGEVACVWLGYIASEGDHRLCEVQPWAQQRLLTLSCCLGKSVRGLDFQDDRLADILDHLALDQRDDHPVWQDCEVELNRHQVRVYNLKADFFRVDASTANSYVDVQSEQGYFQFGHSKDRHDLPQIKVAMSTLDPLGMPMTTFVVQGNCADDPLYVPEIKKVQLAFPQPGKTFVTDCKGAALASRAYVVGANDYYLTPLPETMVSAEQRRALLQPVWQGRQTLLQVCRPGEDEQSQELVAEGFSFDAALTAPVEGRQVNWTERRWLVRSLAYAQGQEAVLARRLQRATTALRELVVRKQGKKQLFYAELMEAAEAIVKREGAEGLISYTVQAKMTTRQVRTYRGKPARQETDVFFEIDVRRQEERIEQKKREMGWRVYATNQLSLSLAAVVWGYRGQNRLEDNWPRLKGKPCGLQPMYLQYESRIVGLVLLLSVVLRLLTIVEWTARKKLQEDKQTLKGLYPGQPGRKTGTPSAERQVRAFKGINLTTVEVAGQRLTHVTPLTALQQTLLALWGLPPDLYQRLAPCHMEPAPDLHQRDTLHFPQPPPR